MANQVKSRQNPKAHAKIAKTHKLATVEVTRHLNGRVEFVTQMLNGEKHGVETGYNSSGIKTKQIRWKEGSWSGPTIWWYQVGTKQREIIRWDSDMHGVATRWYSRGGKQWEIYYRRNKQYARIDWNEEGDVVSVKFPRHKQSLMSIVKSRIAISPKSKLQHV